MLIAVVGDATLDVTVGPPGPMPAGDAKANISVGPGGQGANVAVRLARARMQARLIAPLADDAAGRVLRDHLVSEGVEVRTLPATRTSMVVVLVAPGGARTMFSDRMPVGGELASSLVGCDWVHVSGYVLRDREEAERVTDAIHGGAPARISVAGGSFEGWADAVVARDAIDALPAGLLVVNRDEAALLLRDAERSISDAAVTLATPDRLVVVTDGERGASAAAGWIERPVARPARGPRAPAVDSTGAGDAFTASLIASLAPVWPPSADAVVAALDLAAAEGAAATTAIGAQASGTTGDLVPDA